MAKSGFGGVAVGDGLSAIAFGGNLGKVRFMERGGGLQRVRAAVKAEWLLHDFGLQSVI